MTGFVFHREAWSPPWILDEFTVWIVLTVINFTWEKSGDSTQSELNLKFSHRGWKSERFTLPTFQWIAGSKNRWAIWFRCHILFTEDGNFEPEDVFVSLNPTQLTLIDTVRTRSWFLLHSLGLVFTKNEQSGNKDNHKRFESIVSFITNGAPSIFLTHRQIYLFPTLFLILTSPNPLRQFC